MKIKHCQFVEYDGNLAIYAIITELEIDSQISDRQVYWEVFEVVNPLAVKIRL
jgi:hypothetical protein